MGVLDKIKEADIDPKGVFKYILIKVHEDFGPSDDGKNPSEKVIVRGYKRCSYHQDILEEVTEKEFSGNVEGECLGGGRIEHNPEAKTIKVYGYSQGFGKADHKVSVSILKKVYPDYSITWSDEGY